MQQFFLISLGAVLGANARYWMSHWAQQQWGSRFPVGTVLINLTGSFLLGLFVTLVAERLNLDPRWRLFFTIGFLGSYTTFSTYTLDSLNLFQQGQWGAALTNLFGSAILGGLAVTLGALLGKNI